MPAGLQNRGVEQAPTGTQADYLMAYCSLLVHFCRFYRSTSSRLCAFERIADLLSPPRASVKAAADILVLIFFFYLIKVAAKMVELNERRIF